EHSVLEEPESARIFASVHSAPVKLPGGARIEVDLQALERAGSVARARGRVEVKTSALPALTTGDAVVLRAPLRTPRGFINPGSANAAITAAARGIDASAWSPAGAIVPVKGAHVQGLRALL